MYKIIECEQRSQEWFDARLGKWTGSFFDKLITTTGKASTSADEVNNRLVAEIIIGRPDETFQSEAMLRGAELEGEALDFINFTHGYNFDKIGFMDSGLGYGCSIDGNDTTRDVGLEMKVPSLHTHIEYLSGQCLPKTYKAQVQGAMLITGRKEHVFMSYHPEVKPFVWVEKRDEEFINAMRALLLANCEEVKRRLEKVQKFLKD
jgi:hypothetical protein